MSFNGSGTYTLPLPDVVTGTTISSTWANTTLGNIATNGLSMCIVKDGQTTTTASIPFAQGLTSAGTSTFSSTLNASNGDFYVKTQLIQSFVVKLTNTAGTLQHQIVSDINSGALGSFSGKITGASATLANTPTGADGSTAFVSGAKISSANTNTFVLNTNAQTIADLIGSAKIEANSAAANIICALAFVSRDVNGTTRIRPEVSFFTDGGTAWALTTANISAGTTVTFRVTCYLA